MLDFQVKPWKWHVMFDIIKSPVKQYWGLCVPHGLEGLPDIGDCLSLMAWKAFLILGTVCPSWLGRPS